MLSQSGCRISCLVRPWCYSSHLLFLLRQFALKFHNHIAQLRRTLEFERTRGLLHFAQETLDQVLALLLAKFLLGLAVLLAIRCPVLGGDECHLDQRDDGLFDRLWRDAVCLVILILDRSAALRLVDGTLH